MKFLYRKVNADLERLGDWFDSNSLTLNVEKSKFIIFRNKTKGLPLNSAVRLAGKELGLVQNKRPRSVTYVASVMFLVASYCFTFENR